MIPLFVLSVTLLVVLKSSIIGIQQLCEIVTQCRPPPHQDWRRANSAGSRSARDDKESGPSWGKQLPEKLPRETVET
jgi:hypothetical protein